jgi:hypothetical protein
MEANRPKSGLRLIPLLLGVTYTSDFAAQGAMIGTFLSSDS